MLLQRTAAAVERWPRCLSSSAAWANHTVSLSMQTGTGSASGVRRIATHGRRVAAMGAIGGAGGGGGCCRSGSGSRAQNSGSQATLGAAGASTAPALGLRHASTLKKSATPPPPSAAVAGTTAATSTNRSSSSSIIRSSSLTSSKIPSQRTAQIARHLSSSAAHHQASSATHTSTIMGSEYSLRKVAAPNTLEHRIYIEKDGVPVSPFHDIPLYANQEQTILNMIVEIPRWTNGKLEVCCSSWKPSCHSPPLVRSFSRSGQELRRLPHLG